MLETLTFGAQIRRLRKEKRLQQKELARASGCSESYVSRIEKGEMVPTESIVLNLARALDADERALVLLARQEKTPESAKAIFSALGAADGHGAANGVRSLPVFTVTALAEWARERGRRPPPHGETERAAAQTSDPDAFFITAEAPVLAGGRIQPGDRLLIEPSAVPADGQLVLVKTDGHLRLGRLFQRAQAKVLMPLNEHDAPLLFVRREGEPVVLRVSQAVVYL